jgi:hypothetical protein
MPGIDYSGANRLQPGKHSWRYHRYMTAYGCWHSGLAWKNYSLCEFAPSAPVRILSRAMMDSQAGMMKVSEKASQTA